MLIFGGYTIKYTKQYRYRKYLHDNLSELDNWILTFLGIADDEHIPVTPHTGGGAVRYTKATTNTFQLATVIPQTVLATVDSSKDIQNSFDKLTKRGFLERLPNPRQGFPEEMEGVSITVEGMIAFRKHFRPIGQAIKTDEYENTIDKIQADSWAKEEFKKLKAKLKDKGEDEAWTYNDTGHWNVFFAKSADGGKTLETIMISAPNKGHAVDQNTEISASGGSVYVTWVD